MIDGKEVSIEFMFNVHFLKTNSGKKGQGMPVVRNPQFYFREGFCWSDINTTFLKCRYKSKSINDVKSMSLYSQTFNVPNYYIVSLINSTFFSSYVDAFINNTQTFQINDARQLPIIIPSSIQLIQVKKIYNDAKQIKKLQFTQNINTSKAKNELVKIQNQLDTVVSELYSI